MSERAPDHPQPRLGRAVALTGFAGLASRLTGIVRDAVFSAMFGAGTVADAFYAAFRVPGLFRELLAEGTLTSVAVPLLSEADAKDGRAGMWALANALLGVLLVLLGGITVLLLVFARPFVYLLASGFEHTPGKVDLTVWLVRVLAPVLAGLSLTSLFGAMCNVRGRFFLPALAPALVNGLTVVGCLLAPGWERATGLPAIGAVAVATTLSGAVTALCQLPTLAAEGYRPRPHLRGHPALGRALRFGGAALVGITTVQVSLLIESQLASRMGDGPVSWMVLGFRLVQLPMSLFAGSVAVAGLAATSRLLARGDGPGAREALGHALRLNSLLVAPTAVGLYLLADPLCRLFFQHGAFSAADTAATAGVLRMYALATLAICIHRIAVPTFFALGDPYVPMRLSIAVLLAKLPVALLCVRHFGVPGLALSHALTVTAEVAVLVGVLGRRLGGFPEGFWGAHARMALACVGMGAAVWGMRGAATLGGGFGVLGVCGAGAVIYGALALALGLGEARELLSKLLPPPPPKRPC